MFNDLMSERVMLLRQMKEQRALNETELTTASIEYPPLLHAVCVSFV